MRWGDSTEYLVPGTEWGAAKCRAFGVLVHYVVNPVAIGAVGGLRMGMLFHAVISVIRGEEYALT
jgi:hypothetical protein